jgi:pantoate--beta-alanine ligase
MGTSQAKGQDIDRGGQMELLETIEACRELRKRWAHETIALVPTMGALHEGHLSLVRKALSSADRTVVSIYVNPLQFRPSEDYARYPRPLEADLAKCQQLGVDAVFLPSDEQMYPGGREHINRVIPPDALTQKLCGLSRPGHFTGVATVVMKLFNIVQPDVAVFGEKDAQQLAIIQRMVNDLNSPVRILPHPTVRDNNGLALSSRNQYLTTPQEYQAALVLWKTLQAVQCALVHQNWTEQPAEPVLTQALQTTLLEQGVSPSLFQLDYLEAVHRETFESQSTLTRDTKLLIAARVGAVRLIDNLDLAATPVEDCLSSLPVGSLCPAI